MKERIRVSVFVLFTTKVDVVVTCFAASRGMLLPLYANNLLGLESVILGSELFRALVRKIKALPCPVQSQEGTPRIFIRFVQGEACLFSYLV